MQFGIIALNNSMLHLKIFLLALISFAYITPPLHADLPMFILACFIHSFSFIKHLECIISAAPLYFWSADVAGVEMETCDSFTCRVASVTLIVGEKAQILGALTVQLIGAFI